MRQPNLYIHQDDRLDVGNEKTVIDSFFNHFISDLEPPRLHESLRGFLEQSDASSIHDLQASTNDRRKIVIVDDRSDPCINLNISDNASIILRPWDSQSYNQYPPKGENVQVYGADVKILFERLKIPVREFLKSSNCFADVS
jgi:hypothetical protein